MKWITGLAFLALGTGCTAGSPSTLTYGTGKGVEPLTQESAAEAIKVGESVKSIKKATYQAYCSTSQFSTPKYFFHCTILTPFSEIVVKAYAAKRKYEKFNPGQITGQQVVKVQVDPSLSTFYTNVPLTSVEAVIIRRGEAIVKPLKTEIHSVSFANKLGHRETHKGMTATFPLSEFTPDKGPFKVIVVPAGTPAGWEAVLPLKVSDLKKLR